MERVKPDRFIDKLHRSMMKSFFFKVRAVSYVFLYADFRKNTQKFWHIVFTQNGEFMYGKG